MNNTSPRETAGDKETPKKLVFIGHPIGGNVTENIQKVLRICREVHSDTVIPAVPYVATVAYLDDNDPSERAQGIAACMEHFRRGYIDELWLYGDRISQGMKYEIWAAIDLNIPVHPKTAGTRRDFDAVVGERLGPFGDQPGKGL